MRILKKRRHSRPAEKWPITIYYDDREKTGRYRLNCHKFVLEKERLETGDYAFKGYENIFCIERKRDLQELIGNLTGKKKWKFHTYLERLSKMPTKCIIVGESLEHIVSVLGKHKFSQLKPKDIYYWVGQIMFRYKIPILFYGGKGTERETFLYYIFDSAWQAIK